MSSTQPSGANRQLPRSHLLVLNRSFRRTLEAENKSPRTIKAYTDAVRLLATYCQAHGHPLIAGELEREHIQAFIADQLVSCAGDSLLKCDRVGGWRGQGDPKRR